MELDIKINIYYIIEMAIYMDNLTCAIRMNAGILTLAWGVSVPMDRRRHIPRT